MQTDLWKLFTNSRIFEFATACPKLKILRLRKNVIVFLSDEECKLVQKSSIVAQWVLFFIGNVVYPL